MNGAHREGWTVRKRVEPDYTTRRGNDVYYDVVEAGDRKFTTDNLADAEWLASTLTKLNL